MPKGKLKQLQFNLPVQGNNEAEVKTNPHKKVDKILTYFLGTNRIIGAHQNQFGGWSCGACQSCIQPICDSKSGFDKRYFR